MEYIAIEYVQLALNFGGIACSWYINYSITIAQLTQMWEYSNNL